MNFAALIPARGGSKGIPNKNLREIAGKPLIAHSIDQAKLSGVFSNVYVSTDSTEIADVAKTYGAVCPFLRSPENSTDTAHMFPVYKEFLLKLQSHALQIPDVLFVLLPTNLLRQCSDIQAIHSKWIEQQDAEWIFSCNEMEHHPYRAVRLSPSNKLAPFFPLDRHMMWANRQEFPIAHRFNGAIISGRSSSILSNSEYPIDSFEYSDTNVYGVITSSFSSVDIDTEHDFKIAELLLNSTQVQ